MHANAGKCMWQDHTRLAIEPGTRWLRPTNCCPRAARGTSSGQRRIYLAPGILQLDKNRIDSGGGEFVTLPLRLV